MMQILCFRPFPLPDRLAFKSGLRSVYLACITTFTVFGQPPTLLSSNGMIRAFAKSVPIKIKSCLHGFSTGLKILLPHTDRLLIIDISFEKLNSAPLVSNVPSEKEIKDHNLQQ